MKYVLKRLFGEEFNNLLLLNLLTVGLCIPVVTAGPAILAMKGTLVKILDDRCDLRRIHEFWGLFKKKFWKGLLFEGAVHPVRHDAAVVQVAGGQRRRQRGRPRCTQRRWAGCSRAS